MDRLEALRQRVAERVDAILLLSLDMNPDMNVMYYSGLDCIATTGALYYAFNKEPIILLRDKRQKTTVRKVERKKQDDLYGIMRAKHIGYNGDHVPANTLKHLKQKTGARFHDISKELKTMRRIKDKNELKNISAACSITRKALKIAENDVLAGKRETDIHADVQDHYLKHGVRPAFTTLVQGGKNALYIHSLPTKEKARGTVIIDTGCRVNGYCSDLTRTYCARPTPPQERMMQLVEEANELARKEARPGMQAKDLYETVNAFFGTNAKHWKYGLGHGIGLNVHEAPNIGKESEDTLEQGMVFTIEPGLAIPRVGGARLEHIGVLTKKGFKAL